MPRLSCDGLIVRLRKRKGTEVIGHDNCPYVLEVGYPGRTVVRGIPGELGRVKERGRMVACTLTFEDQVVPALHAVADLYEKTRERDNETQQRIIVGG